MTNYKLAYELSVLKFEGIYSNNVLDRGGETYRGISRVFNSSFKGWGIIDSYKGNENFINLLIEDKNLEKLVFSFYKENFWNRLSCDAISSQKLAIKLFDIAVNQGVKTSAIYLQKSLNLLNKNIKLFDNLKEDGILGINTLKALEITLNNIKKGKNYISNESILLKLISFFQMKKYIDLVEKNENQSVFLYGWINRV